MVELAATIEPPEPPVRAVEEPSAIIVEPIPIADAPTSLMITAAAEPPAAVAEPSGDEEEVPPTQPEGIEHVPPPPPADLPPPPPPAFPPPIKTQVCAPAAPVNAKHLLGMLPPLPARPTPLVPANIPPADESAVAAESSVLRAVLDLAREIRRPNTYVGYAAFLLMALAKRVRPIAWEGTAQMDLVEVFAPWATESCSEACAVDVVCCAMEAKASGHARLCAIVVAGSAPVAPAAPI